MKNNKFRYLAAGGAILLFPADSLLLLIMTRASFVSSGTFDSSSFGFYCAPMAIKCTCIQHQAFRCDGYNQIIMELHRISPRYEQTASQSVVGIPILAMTLSRRVILSDSFYRGSDRFLRDFHYLRATNYLFLHNTPRTTHRTLSPEGKSKETTLFYETLAASNSQCVYAIINVQSPS